MSNLQKHNTNIVEHNKNDQLLANIVNPIPNIIKIIYLLSKIVKHSEIIFYVKLSIFFYVKRNKNVGRKCKTP